MKHLLQLSILKLYLVLSTNLNAEELPYEVQSISLEQSPIKIVEQLAEKFGQSITFEVYGVGIQYFNARCDSVTRNYNSSPEGLIDLTNSVKKSKSTILLNENPDSSIEELLTNYYPIRSKTLLISQNDPTNIIEVHNRYQKQINSHNKLLDELKRKLMLSEVDSSSLKSKIEKIKNKIKNLAEARDSECGIKYVKQRKFSEYWGGVGENAAVMSPSDFISFIKNKGNIKGVIQSFQILETRFNHKIDKNKHISLKFIGNNFVPGEIKYIQRFNSPLHPNSSNVETSISKKFGIPHLSQPNYFRDQDRFVYFSTSRNINSKEISEYKEMQLNSSLRLRNRKKFNELKVKYSFLENYEKDATHMLVTLNKLDNSEKVEKLEILVTKKHFIEENKRIYKVISDDFVRGKFSQKDSAIDI